MIDDAAEPEDEDEGESRYDQMAEGYAKWWAPVIRPGAERVLDIATPTIEAALARTPEPRVLDVGSGTGTLAIAALERWPALRVTGIDPSGAMLAVARADAAQRLAGRAERYVTEIAYADRMPFDDGSFDLAMSSFVLQLVPSRAAALREIHRVLKPDGVLAWVTWQRTERAYAPDRIANEVLDAAGFDPPEADTRPGDVASPASAMQSMRRAGFRAVTASTAEVEHPWDAADYLAFLTDFDEESLFAELESDERRDIENQILDGLRRLSRDELMLRLPVIYAMGRASA
jgi:ubiquinone/menaquinone biosynthesis C-methylase UbiE